MKLLLTGATGILGRHLLARLAGSHDVLAISRGDPPAELLEAARWIRHDLTQPPRDDLLPDTIDGVIHLAQSERYRDFPAGAEDLFSVNVASTFLLLEYARRAGALHFVLASTGGVYRPQPEPISESAPIELVSPYFRSKAIAELLLDDYRQFFSAVVLRFFFVYGAGPSRMLVSRLVRQIVGGEQIVVDGDPGLRINPIFAEDAAAAIEAALALEAPAVVNVAGEEIVSVTELVGRLARALGRAPNLSHSGPGPDADLIADINRLRTSLGVTPRYSLDEGLAAVATALTARGAGR